MNKDVGLIGKFAEFEFKYGEVDRGVTLFETLLASHPKRLDLWFIYIDMLSKCQRIEQARYILFYIYTDILRILD